MRATSLFLLIVYLGAPSATAGETSDSGDFPKIELDQAVHFNSFKGDDILIPAGTYHVTVEKDSVRFTPPTTSERQTKPMLVQASASSHELDLRTPELLSIVGENGNALHLIYLIPGGRSHEAVGFYSEVRTRAVRRIWSKRINQPQVYRQYTSLSALQTRVGSQVRSLAQLSAQMTRLQVKFLELQEAIYDDNIDQAKAHYNAAKEQFTSALRILQEHQKRQSQVVQKITR